MKKRALSLLMAFILVIGLLPTAAWAAETGPQGSGTADEPYLIGTAEELKWFRDLVNGSTDAENHRHVCAKLTADIDLKGDEWNPIGGNDGYATSYYAGQFDGNGKRISNFKITAKYNYAGFFSYVKDNAYIHDLKISKASISSEKNNAGGIIGTMIDGTVEKCSFDGEVKGLNTSRGYAGGIVGYLGNTSKTSPKITNCANFGSISAGYAGGITGYAKHAKEISNCYNTGRVNGSTRSGGIVGQNMYGTKITNCFNTGAIEGTGIGAIAGFAGVKITNCYWTQPAVGKGGGAGTINEDGEVDSIASVAGQLGSAFRVVDGEVVLAWEAGGTPAEKNPRIVISGGSTLQMTNSGEQPHTTLTVEYKDMDETPAVTWTADNACVTLETPNNATETNHTVIVHAVKPGTVKITAVAGEYTAEFTMSIVPRVTTVEIKNVNQPGAVAVGQTVQAQVNILGGDEYDYENYPKLTYQWYQGTTPIQEATNRTYKISDDFKEWDKIGVNVACNGEAVHSYNDHQQSVRSAEYGKLYPVAHDEEFTLPAEIKEDTKLKLLTEHTKDSVTADIAWSSDNLAVIAEDGTVTRPAAGKTEVKLTARFTYGAAYANRMFKITVWSQAAVEEEANDKRLALNNDIDAANISVLTPVYGTDTNVLEMVTAKLGRKDIKVTMGAPERTNATAKLGKDVVNIAENGAITYFYVDPNGEATANLQRFGTFSVPFTFERGGVTVERTFAVTVYWDRAKVESAMERDIVSDLPAVPSTATENFELPKVVNGKTWTDITWTSSDNAIYISSERQSSADKLLEPYVAVVRGSSVEKTVTLTAKLTFRYTNDVTGSEEPITLLRIYTVTVPASADGLKYQEALDAVFTADKLTDAATGAALDLGAVKNDIQFPTTRDLNTYLMAKYRKGFDGKYTPLVITSSDTAVIAEPDVANAARVAVYRPAVGEKAKTVTLTVKILDRPSGSGRDYANLPVLAEKRFTVTVQPLTEAEITNELALMAEVKAHYWDGIKNRNTAARDVTGDLAPFVEVYKENDALVWVRDVREMQNSGIVPVAMDGWQELEAWRLFRSSNPAAVTHENLLVTQQFEGKAVTVTSALSSETLGRYGELYRKDRVKYAAYAELADLYYQPVSAELVVRGRNTANMVVKMIPVNGGTETRLVSKAVEEKVTVSFTLSGNGELWLGTRMIRDLDEGVTVFDVLEQLRDVLSFKHKGGYVQSITCNGKTLAELDEGKNSGWLYTVNGELPDVYMSAYGLKNGDSVRVYFTKDYTKEPGADRWKPVTPVTKTETVTNPDGSTTKTETKPDGTTVETTTKPDGSTTVAETKPDGSVSTVEKRADGTEIKTAQPASGGITASVSVPKSVGSTRVDIPVSKPTGSMVAVIVHPDGTEEIVKGSIVTETGVALRAEGNVRLKIIDNAKRFNDMADHWAKDAVEFASSRELFNGVGNDAFGPDLSMTRGMVNTVLARLAGADTTGGETWYAKGTVWAVENGISDGTAPEQPVTREQLAAMLYRYAGSPAVSGELSFDDTTVISIWAYDAVRWCVDNGILNGVGGNRMTPQDLARRGQVAAMLMRFLQATV